VTSLVVKAVAPKTLNKIPISQRKRRLSCDTTPHQFGQGFSQCARGFSEWRLVAVCQETHHQVARFRCVNQNLAFLTEWGEGKWWPWKAFVWFLFSFLRSIISRCRPVGVKIERTNDAAWDRTRTWDSQEVCSENLARLTVSIP
jgi:hypothetical protein